MVIYKLLALNIDGTLLQSNGKLHKSTKEAVAYVKDKGIYVTLVTSRNFMAARKVAKALDVEAVLITHQGAFIAKQINEPLMVKRIPEDITFEIVRFLEGLSCQIRIVHEKYSLANKSGLWNNLFAKAVVNTGDPLFYPQQFVDSISDTIMDDPVSPPEIQVIFQDQEDLIDSQLAIRNMYPEVNTIPINEVQLDIVPRDASKLNGLLYVAEHLGFNRKEIVVIGDGTDDIEMIEGVGLGVAMGNASIEVKSAADWITRSNNEQGVTYMVKEHFRKQQPLEFLRKMNIID